MEEEHERSTKNDAHPRTTEPEEEEAYSAREQERNPTQTMPISLREEGPLFSAQDYRTHQKQRGSKAKKHNNSSQGRAAMKQSKKTT